MHDVGWNLVAFAPGWISRMTVTSAWLLLGALLADRLLAKRVAPGVRLVLYLAVILKPFLPAEWPASLTFTGGLGIHSVLGGAPWMEGSLASPAASSSTAVWQFWVGGIYLLGCIVLLGRWIFSRVRMGQLVREARPLPTTGEVHPGIALVEHASLGPLVAGLLHPRIVLPRSLFQSSPTALNWVLAHESAHIQRRDPWLIAMVQLTCIAGWPIVPLWIAARRLRALVEMACDERALAGRSVHERRAYGELLVAFAEGQPPLRGWSLVPSWVSDLRARIGALRFWHRWHRGLQVGIIAGFALGLFALTGHASEPPEGDGAAPSGAAERSPSEKDKATETESGNTTPAKGGPKLLTMAVASDQLLTNPATDPRYRFQLPPALRKKGTTVYAVVKICVSRQGDVDSTKLVKSMHPDADPLLLEKVKTWKYRPYQVDGRPIPFCYPLRYDVKVQ